MLVVDAAPLSRRPARVFVELDTIGEHESDRTPDEIDDVVAGDLPKVPVKPARLVQPTGIVQPGAGRLHDARGDVLVEEIKSSAPQRAAAIGAHTRHRRHCFQHVREGRSLELQVEGHGLAEIAAGGFGDDRAATDAGTDNDETLGLQQTQRFAQLAESLT